jgi:hypothetical protein
MKAIAVCIMDDNKELRNALEEIISISRGYKCVGTIGGVEDAVHPLYLKLIVHCRPLTINLSVASKWALIKNRQNLRKNEGFFLPFQLKFVILSFHICKAL